MRSPEIREAFARFIEREQDLSAFLNAWIQRDRAMLGDEPVRADAPPPGPKQ